MNEWEETEGMTSPGQHCFSSRTPLPDPQHFTLHTKLHQYSDAHVPPLPNNLEKPHTSSSPQDAVEGRLKVAVSPTYTRLGLLGPIRRWCPSLPHQGAPRRVAAASSYEVVRPPGGVSEQTLVWLATWDHIIKSFGFTATASSMLYYDTEVLE